MFRRLGLLVLGVLASSSLGGCSLLPEIAHQPTIHNPFPQLSRVAIAPFFNASTEPTVDGRRFALAYFNELQSVPGYEVVPVGIVETQMEIKNIQLNSAADVQRLARELDVDAVVIGVVTDYSPYYPPRLGLQVKWFAANPGFHPIPPGYGLPWGTPGEEGIPAPLVFEAEMALAKAQLKTQTPDCDDKTPAGDEKSPETDKKTPQAEKKTPGEGAKSPGEVSPASHVAGTGNLPKNWPDPRGFIPPPPRADPPTCWPTDAPVMQHTRNFNGHDMEFTEALASHYFFRDDARFGGWQGYLDRSDDFIQFCCRMHIWEMLAARGGAGETRVVWRWPTIR
ncbi:MAG: hypothetical protein JW809_06590 [Pirellulales bacterium]|nr:hypothetical protein [Pirellulales bacterium]